MNSCDPFLYRDWGSGSHEWRARTKEGQIIAAVCMADNSWMLFTVSEPEKEGACGYPIRNEKQLDRTFKSLGQAKDWALKNMSFLPAGA